MNFGSVFAGIGGLDLGLERAGMECKWQVEIDPYGKRVLKKHFPNVAQFGDIRECGAHNLNFVDLICGGFPCQDISNANTAHAGGLLGLAGARSGLWREYARIICELEPRWVLIENVGAVTVRGIGAVLWDLAASGYDAEWATISAASLGAVHQRKRLYIVAERRVRFANEMRDDGDGELWCDECEMPYAECRHPGPDNWTEDFLQDPNRERLERDERRILAQPDNWRHDADLARSARGNPTPRVCGRGDGIPHRMDRLKGLGNAVVPQVAQWIGERIMEAACSRTS